MIPDPLREVLSRFYTPYKRPKLECRVWYHYERHHDAPLEPLTPRWIRPHRIDRRVSQPSSLEAVIDPPGAVLGGDWDRDTLSVESHPYHDFFTAHFVDGIPWDETAFFEQKYRGITDESEGANDRQATWHECRTVEDLYERFREIDALYEDMKRNGYMTQRELRERDSPPFGAPRPSALSGQNEIVVAIDRHGEFLFVSGGHRFFIARILDLDRIAVHVLVRHREWQRIRDRIYNARSVSNLPDTYENYIDHPDVRGIAPNRESVQHPA